MVLDMCAKIVTVIQRDNAQTEQSAYIALRITVEAALKILKLGRMFLLVKLTILSRPTCPSVEKGSYIMIGQF